MKSAGESLRVAVVVDQTVGEDADVLPAVLAHLRPRLVEEIAGGWSRRSGPVRRQEWWERKPSSFAHTTVAIQAWERYQIRNNPGLSHV
jgi:hypothetical protein